MWWIFLTMVTNAHAEVPLPSYREALATSAWYRVNELIEHANHLASEELSDVPLGSEVDLTPKVSQKYLEALQLAEKFEAQVMETSGLAYLRGLTWRQMGDLKKSENHLRRSIKLDSTAPDAWYDLGEILFIQEQYAEARQCFEEVSLLLTTGPNAWRGPIRVAEVAGHQGDVASFEANIREALRRGFSLHQIGGQPQWKSFYADERLKDSVQKLVKVYGDPSILKSLAE